MAGPSDSELTLERVEHALLAPQPHAPSPPFWYWRSIDEPGWFWPFLQRQRARLAPQPPKSAFGVQVDIFNDLVALNGESRAPAWSYLSGGREQQISYPQLLQDAQRLAAGFRAQGVTAGQTICVVRHFGLPLITAALAAWRLGAVLSLLPPDGSLYTRRRLAALAPEWVELDALHRSLIDGLELAVLERQAPAGQAFEERSHSYPADSPAARLFDRASASTSPRDVSAQALYFGALRDGLLGLGLRPGRAIAAVGLDTLQAQPSLLLATLLCGATYLHVELEQLQQQPSLLARPLRAVGLSVAAREALLSDAPEVGEQWGCWFRDPGEDSDLERWDEMATALSLSGSWAVNLRWESCFGGCSIFSHRRKYAHPFVLPAAGCPWELRNVVDPEQPALGDVGFLALGPAGKPRLEAELAPTRDLIAGRRDRMVFGEAVVSGHWGRGLLTEEVLEALADVTSFPLSLAQLPLEGRLGTRCNVLLVFCGADVPPPGLRETIERALFGRLGTIGEIDRVELLPLWPRRDDEGAVDHDYYANELAAGAVHRAAGDPLARAISALRQSVDLGWRAAEAKA